MMSENEVMEVKSRARAMSMEEILIILEEVPREALLIEINNRLLTLDKAKEHQQRGTELLWQKPSQSLVLGQ